MGAAEIRQFLARVAVKGHVSASTQNQALNALLFLYAHVLEIDVGKLDALPARRRKRLPVVLSAEEVQRKGAMRHRNASAKVLPRRQGHFA